ncbi:hypothetical protein BsWGS_10037 [Bradybaena similaris]
MSWTEQCTNVKFSAILEKSPSETLTLFNKAYGDTAMKKSKVFEWQKRFREVCVSIDDDKCNGRPATSINNENIECVRSVVLADRRPRCHENSLRSGISVASCQSILHNELHMILAH